MTLEEKYKDKRLDVIFAINITGGEKEMFRIPQLNNKARNLGVETFELLFSLEKDDCIELNGKFKGEWDKI